MDLGDFPPEDHTDPECHSPPFPLEISHRDREFSTTGRYLHPPLSFLFQLDHPKRICDSFCHVKGEDLGSYA